MNFPSFWKISLGVLFLWRLLPLKGSCFSFSCCTENCFPEKAKHSIWLFLSSKQRCVSLIKGVRQPALFFRKPVHFHLFALMMVRLGDKVWMHRPVESPWCGWFLGRRAEFRWFLARHHHHHHRGRDASQYRGSHYQNHALPAGPLPRSCFRTDVCAGFAGCKRLRHDKAGLQADKHSDGGYETVRSKKLAHGATSVYYSSKEFAYDHIMREEVVTFAKATDSRLNIKVNTQGRSLKGILLLFIEPYSAGTRSSKNTLILTSPKWASRWMTCPTRSTTMASRRSLCGGRSAGSFSPKTFL